MHLKDIHIIDSFNITGRGKMLATDLDFDSNFCYFNKGDTLRYDDKIYEVIGIEALLKAGGKEFIAFVVKEISIKDLFNKHATKQSDWIRKAKWRQRNWWWLLPWKRMQIYWLCNIKPFFKKLKK